MSLRTISENDGTKLLMYQTKQSEGHTSVKTRLQPTPGLEIDVQVSLESDAYSQIDGARDTGDILESKLKGKDMSQLIRNFELRRYTEDLQTLSAHNSHLLLKNQDHVQFISGPEVANQGYSIVNHSPSSRQFYVNQARTVEQQEKQKIVTQQDRYKKATR